MRLLLLCALILGAGCDTEPELPTVASPWTKQAEPVWTGDIIASDPSVVRDDDSYRMCYTCLDPATDRTAICGAGSSDGITWAHSPDRGTPTGLLIRGQPGTPEASVEGCELVKRDDEWLLYYSGYPEAGSPTPGFPASLYLASSTDGITFEREGIVLDRSAGGRDNDAVYSPTILDQDGTLSMVYTGHCYSGCRRGDGVVLLAATSTDGRTWTKASAPVLTPDESISWTTNGIGEAALFPDGSDGLALLVTGGLGDDETQRIGLARASSLEGPWTLALNPVLTPTPGAFDAAGVLAPSVLVEGDRARAWFFGLSENGAYAIGVADTSYPLSTP
ncbi:MAG: hypothetical protein Rubg2KO_27160 [Rubricoccaceae bacterium]